MRHVKSERLKKFESELTDLEQWLKLGLVPKKDIEKHKEEINSIKAKIEEEKERLQFLKENGESEEYIAPKKNNLKPGYNDMPTMPDVDAHEGGSSETGFDVDTDVIEVDNTSDDRGENDDYTESDEDDESYFSDKNRWRRGGIIDPDANDW